MYKYSVKHFYWNKAHTFNNTKNIIAAVLYLTPDAPVDTGTEFYKQVNYDIPPELNSAYTDVCGSVAMGNPITEEQQKIYTATK